MSDGGETGYIATFGGRFYAAAVTPFGEDGDIDHDALAGLVDHVFAQGLDGIYAGGSSAEAFLMSDEERATTFRTIAGATAGRGRLIAHVGSISLRSARSLAETAADLGYDAVSSVTPFFHAFSLAEIARFFTAITAATDLPLVLYHIPARSGVRLTAEQVAQLTMLPGVAGVKYTDSDYFAMGRVVDACPGRVVLNGYDETLLQGLMAGAHGGIGTTYAVQGARLGRLVAAVAAGDLDTARSVQRKISELAALMLRYGVFQSTKVLLDLQGVAAGRCRAPFEPISDEGRAALRAYVESDKGADLGA